MPRVFDFTFEGEAWTVDALDERRPVSSNTSNPIRIAKVGSWFYEGQEYKVSMIAIPDPHFVRSVRIKALKPGTELTRKQRDGLYEHWLGVVAEAAKAIPPK